MSSKKTKPSPKKNFPVPAKKVSAPVKKSSSKVPEKGRVAPKTLVPKGMKAAPVAKKPSGVAAKPVATRVLVSKPGAPSRQKIPARLVSKSPVAKTVPQKQLLPRASLGAKPKPVVARKPDAKVVSLQKAQPPKLAASKRPPLPKSNSAPKPLPAKKALPAKKSLLPVAKVSSKPVAKAPAKLSSATKAGAKAAVVKAPAKLPPKSAAKAPEKAVGKVQAKVSSKPAVKAPAKLSSATKAGAKAAVVKASAKLPPKSAAKAPEKAVGKVQAKVSSKPVVKAPAKLPPKSAAKASKKAVGKVQAKVSSKPVVKAPAKPQLRAVPSPAKRVPSSPPVKQTQVRVVPVLGSSRCGLKNIPSPMVQSPLARLKAEREAAAKAKAAAEEFKRAMKAAQEAAIQAKAEKSKAALAKVEGKGKGKALTETPAKPEKSVAKATLVKSTKVAEGGAGSKKAAVKATATPSTEEPASELAPERPLTTRMRTGVYFSYEDAIEYLAKHKDVKPNAYVPGDERTKSTKGKPTAKSTIPAAALKTKSRDIAAASIEDLLGFNPFNEEGAKHDESQIPAKCLKYYRILVKMRNRLQQGLSLHTEDALKKSDKEGAGDLTGYGQHMADAGTEAFDRDFALNLVSTEQEALYEIAEAIERMKRGTYGVCEQTGKQIPASRLLAVPHTRFTFEGQREREYHRRVARRNNVSNPLEEFAADGTSYSASGTTPSTDNAEEG